MPATVVGTVSFPDERIGRHFGHHPQFSTRSSSGSWRFSLVQVPIADLHCLYPDPGVRTDNPAGLMGSVGASPIGYAGVPIQTMIALIAAALARGSADLQNPALQWVLRLRTAGIHRIRAQDQPLALSHLNGVWFVREGLHRVVALGLLGAQYVEAADFESGALDPGAG